MVALSQSPYFTFHSAYIKCKICYFIFLNVMYVYYTVGMAIDINHVFIVSLTGEILLQYLKQFVIYENNILLSLAPLIFCFPCLSFELCFDSKKCKLKRYLIVTYTEIHDCSLTIFLTQVGENRTASVSQCQSLLLHNLSGSSRNDHLPRGLLGNNRA